MENTGQVIASGDVIKEAKVTGIMIDENQGLFSIQRIVDYKVEGKSILASPAQENVVGKISEVTEIKSFVDFVRNYSVNNEKTTN